jgi:hypothetical protein
MNTQKEQNEKQHINDTRGGRNFTHDNGWHGTIERTIFEHMLAGKSAGPRVEYPSYALSNA